ncbi:hypothetical protein ZEAMMB73_Zm00001d029486 [Zea mays]|uniref:Uncharacterized protein n=1 Tax=Zea mays TaxID=4577 RepID=A0A1D6K5H2_MAIZE|nr:hypothetical protein ZEAMMB73_Zm00001d029486 [Zea mays]
MVQSFKGILADRSEGEIYATLCDCGMDPDIAVDRLISQENEVLDLNVQIASFYDEDSVFVTSCYIHLHLWTIESFNPCKFDLIPLSFLILGTDLFEVVEPSKKGRYLTKKRLKLQRKRIKNERKEANKNDQQSIMRKGKKIKQKFLKAKARLKYKIEKVINGINKRPNCGYEMFHSSVITAARKALVYVIPSIAISLNWYM